MSKGITSYINLTVTASDGATYKFAFTKKSEARRAYFDLRAKGVPSDMIELDHWPLKLYQTADAMIDDAADYLLPADDAGKPADYYYVQTGQ